MDTLLPLMHCNICDRHIGRVSKYNLSRDKRTWVKFKKDTTDLALCEQRLTSTKYYYGITNLVKLPMYL